MKTFALTGSLRNDFGKTKVKIYRDKGLTPAVLYHEGRVTHFSVSTKDIMKAIYSSDTFLFEISIDGQEHKAILKSHKFHPVFSDYLLDVEFYKVTEQEQIQVKLPIKLVGTAEGALAGGKLVQKQRKLTVRGLYTKLPNQLEIDISKLRLGKSLKVGELSFTDFLIPMAKDVPIATVEITRQLRQEAAKQGK